MYLSLSPQFATIHQATHVNEQPTPCHVHNEFKEEAKFTYFKIVQQYSSIYMNYNSLVSLQGPVLQSL